MEPAPGDEQISDGAEGQRQREGQEERVSIEAPPLPRPEGHACQEGCDLKRHPRHLEGMEFHHPHAQIERLVAHVEHLGEDEGIARARKIYANRAHSCCCRCYHRRSDRRGRIQTRRL